MRRNGRADTPTHTHLPPPDTPTGHTHPLTHPHPRTPTYTPTDPASPRDLAFCPLYRAGNVVPAAPARIVQESQLRHPAHPTALQPSRRRRDCHFGDAPSPSILKHLLKVEGRAAEWQSRQRLLQPSEVLVQLEFGELPDLDTAVQPPRGQAGGVWWCQGWRCAATPGSRSA